MTPLPAPPLHGGSLSIVIPAFNEEHNLPRTLERLIDYLSDIVFEIVVVDDGSTDGTVDAVSAVNTPRVKLLQFDTNRGKGAAIKAGVAACRHDWTLLCDADLATPIEDLERLATAARDAPIVLGSRAAPGAEVARSMKRGLTAWTFRMIRRSLGLCPGILDTQCGFHLIETRWAKELFEETRLERFAFVIEFLELARSRGLQIREVGIHWQEAPTSTVRPLRDGAAMVRDALTLKLRLSRDRKLHRHDGGDSEEP